MRFSVIIPCYNAAQTIIRALDSLIYQQYDDWEVICVDDCSSDNTIEVIERYICDHPGHIVLLKNKQNVGAGESRNTGIKASRGDYLCFLDSDDYYDNSFFEVLSKQIDKTDSDIVFYGCRQVLGRVVRNRPTIVLKSIPDFMALEGGSFWGGVWRRSLWSGLNIPAISNAEDIALIPVLISRASVINTIDNLLYYYVYRPDSASSKHIPQVSYNFVTSFNYTLEHLDIELYHEPIEFHGIKTIIYGATLNGIKSGMKDSEIRRLWTDFENKFPNWIKNKYINSYPLPKRLFLRLASWHFFMGIRVFVGIHELLLKIM